MNFSASLRPAKEMWAFLNGKAYWKAEMLDGREWCELDEKRDLVAASRRTLQWHDDLVSSGDVLRIKYLWLYGPRSDTDPEGGTVRFEIKEPGTAFCFHGASLNMTSGYRYPTYLACGRVLEKATGVCELGVYDYMTRHLYVGKTNIYDIGKWRPDGPPVGTLALDLIGLRL